MVAELRFGHQAVDNAAIQCGRSVIAICCGQQLIVIVTEGAEFVGSDAAVICNSLGQSLPDAVHKALTVTAR